MEYILVANILKVKRSSVQGKIPLTTDIDLGELAVNTYDGKLFLKKNVGGTETIVDVTVGADAGTVLNLLKTVDGSGSGLDADLVEGMHAVSTNTVNSIVARDASGNFSAGTITAALSGNASTTTKLATARTISITGDVTGSVSFDGSADASITATIAANSVALGTDTTGNYVADVTAGSYITKSGTAGEGWSPTIAVDATSANTASKVVARDASGNFSAGTITAALSGNASTATTLQTARNINGVSFNGSADITVTANTANSHVIKFDTGATEGTDLYTFNGSAAKTIDIKAGTNITLTKAAGVVTINANDTSVDWSEIQNKPDPVVTVTLTGDVTGSGNATLTDLASGTISFATTIAANSVALGTDTTGNYVADVTAGSYITKSGTAGEGWSPTIAVDATSANTASKVVARDASGNFSAGTITATLSGNASTVTNGIYTTGSYADPAWITSINYSKLTGTIPTWNQNTTGSAAKWTTARTLSFTGDATGSGSVDGSANVATALTLANSGVTAGTYTKITVDAKGRATSGTTLTASDIPSLDAAKITSGVFDAARLPSYVDDVLEYTNLASFPTTGETGKIYVDLATNKTYRWSGTVYVYITSGAVDSVAGKTGVVTLTNSDVGLGNVENKSSATIRSELTSTNVTTALGFTPYNATNPNGYTANTGTVTSVSGTGTASGLTLSGTVTSSGSLTLSGTVNALAAGTYGINISGNAATATNADTLDGQHGSYYQPASTAITTSNIGSQSVNYASSAGSASSATSSSNTNAINNTGYGNGNGTYYQSSGAFAGYSGWAGYWVSSHGDGATYYNQTFIMPFWSAPQYSRLQGGTLVGPYTFITTENQTSYAPSLTGTGASGTWGINVTGYAKYLSGAPAYTNGTDGWWRSAGQAGWYNSDYAVGIYATEAGNVRTYNGANFIAAGNVTAYSDERLKENWRNLPVDFVEQLAGVKCGIYDRIDTEFAKTQVGVSAQSLQNVMSNAIIEDSEGILSVAYGNAALVSAVELAKEVVSLKAEVTELKNLVANLLNTSKEQ